MSTDRHNEERSPVSLKESTTESEEHSFSDLDDNAIEPELVEVLDRIDDPQDRETIQRYLIRSESSRGPFPPPGFILGYEEAREGLGAQVLESAIRRVDATTKEMVLDGRTRRRLEEWGQVIAAVIAVLFFLGCVILILLGHQVGAWLAGFLIIAIVVAFIGSSKIELIAESILRRDSLPPK